MPWLRKATDTPFGLRPYDEVKRIRPYNKSTACAAVYPGDPVVKAAGNTIAVGGASSTQYLGVAAMYSPVSTAEANFLVYDHPDQLFVCQDDGDTTAMTSTHTGMNVDLTTTTGDTSTLQSKVELDSDTAAITAGLAMKVLGLHEIEDASYATAAGQQRKWVVMFNAHYYRDVVGQTGV